MSFVGYDATGNEWDDYSRYVNPEGVDMSSVSFFLFLLSNLFFLIFDSIANVLFKLHFAHCQGVYGDNASLLYHHGYGYASYAPYSPAGSPVPTMGNDGQLYGPQHYQYPPYFQPLTPTSGAFAPTPAVPPQGEVATSVAADQKSFPVEAANGNSNGVTNGGNAKGNNGAAPVKPAYQNSFGSNASYERGAMLGRGPTSGYQDPRFVFDGVRSPIPWIDAPLFSDGQPRPVSSTTITSSVSGGNNGTASRNQTFRPNSQYMVCNYG